MSQMVYRRTVKLYWIKDRSRGRQYIKPYIKITLPQKLVKTIWGVDTDSRIIFDLEVREDGSILLVPLAAQST